MINNSTPVPSLTVILIILSTATSLLVTRCPSLPRLVVLSAVSHQHSILSHLSAPVMSMSPSLLFVVLLSLLLSVRAQPPAPEGLPVLPGMGSDDDDTYTIYQMDPSTASMLGYESYDAFDVMGAGDEFGVGQLVSLGSKKGTFHMPQPLQMVEAAPKYEQLPTETLKTRYLKPITKTT